MKIYNITGGIGRQIAFTSLIPELAKDEKIITLSPYPDLFMNNPYVERSLAINTPYVWADYIQKEENEILCPEPYFNSDFIKRKIHIIEAFARELNIDYNESMLPQVFLPVSLIKDAERFAKENGDFIIVQFTGGQSPLNVNLQKEFIQPLQKKYYSHAQELINEIKKQYPKLKILNYSLPNESKLQDTIQIEAPYLFYVALLEKCKTFIAIDSSLQHMSAINKKQGIVLWSGTSPVSFGYKHNINISGECSQNDLHCSRPYTRELGDLDATGKVWECPNPICQNIEVEKIIMELKKYQSNS